MEYIRLPSILKITLDQQPQHRPTITKAIEEAIADYNSLKREIGEIETIKLAYAEMDKLTKIRLEDKTQNPSSCRKGCSYCCEVYVCISDSEARALFANLKENKIPIDWRKLKRQASRGMDTWCKQSKEDRTCIFLKDGACSIYEFRPGACRNYHVASSPLQCKVGSTPIDVAVIPMAPANIILTSLWFKQTVGSMAAQLLKIRKEEK